MRVGEEEERDGHLLSYVHNHRHLFSISLVG